MHEPYLPQYTSHPNDMFEASVTENCYQGHSISIFPGRPGGSEVPELSPWPQAALPWGLYIGPKKGLEGQQQGQD